MMVWVLLLAALFVGTADEHSMFDEPYNWPRIVICAVLVLCATLIYAIRGDE